MKPHTTGVLCADRGRAPLHASRVACIAVALNLGGVAVGCKHPPKVEATVSVTEHNLVVVVRTAPGASVRVRDVTPGLSATGAASPDRSRSGTASELGLAVLNFGAAARFRSGHNVFAVAVDHEGSAVATQVGYDRALDLQSVRLINAGPTDYAEHAGRVDLNRGCGAYATFLPMGEDGAVPVKLKGDPGITLQLGAQTFVIPTAASGEGELTINVDVRQSFYDLTLSSGFGSHVAGSLPCTITAPGATPRTETVRTEMVSGGERLFELMFQGVRSGPVPFVTPLDPDPANRTTLYAVPYGERRVLGRQARLRDVDYVVLTQMNQPRDIGRCGPYSGNTYIPRRAYDHDVSVYATASGRLLGQQTFRPPTPRCPRTWVVRNGVLGAVTGAAPVEEVIAWVTGLLRAAT